MPTVKDAADKEIRKKAEELASNNPEISTFIFASGDGYFIELARKLRQAGKNVVFMPYSNDNFHKQYWVVLNSRNIFFLKPFIR